VLDGKKYLQLLSAVKFLIQTCPHCGSETNFISGGDFFCNFCEQHNDPALLQNVDRTAQVAFVPVLSQMNTGNLDEALKNAERLMKNNADAKQLYLLGLFYRNVSGIRYYQKDYALKGFMEANAASSASSLGLTSRWKECFFKAIGIIDGEISKNLQIEIDLVFIKFISEVRLRRFVDAANTLRRLQNMDRHGIVADYALLVYSVEKNTGQAEASIAKAAARNNVNAYYYLAEYLARQKKLEEAGGILEKLDKTTEIAMVQELLNRVRATQEASKM
jgi:tetratricopeptide (TPR) repeat protein